MDWHYAENGQQIGPVSEERLLELAHAGSVKPDTLVWHSGLAEWKSLREAGPGSATPPPFSSNGATRFCSSCGRSFSVTDLAMFGDSAICMECKPAWVQRLRQGMVTSTPMNFHYAGFWIRFVAEIIDIIIVGTFEGLAFKVFFGGSIFGVFSPAGRARASAGALSTFRLMLYVVSAAWDVYFWVRFGATPGKMAMGLKVVSPDGGPISIGQAIGRWFAKLLSTLSLFIGYMMAGWDEQKRALHDRLANTRVIRVR